MERTQRTTLGSLLLTCAVAVSPRAVTRAQGVTIDPCSVLTKAEIARLVGSDKVLRTPPEKADLNGGRVSCSFEAGGTGRTIEVILGRWTSPKPFSVPPKSKAVTGIGDGAYSDQDAHGAAVFAKVGSYSLRVGAQNDDETGEKLRDLVIATAKVVAPKLK
jgi:hypothetical protein